MLKEACLAFVREMEDLTGDNPLTNCVTIDCQYSLSCVAKPDLIALEPRNRWLKNQVNQSQEAISKVGDMGRIQHVRNSLNGEVKVLTPAQKFCFV